jgi:hypothetical protein
MPCCINGDKGWEYDCRFLFCGYFLAGFKATRYCFLLPQSVFYGTAATFFHLPIKEHCCPGGFS